MKANAIHRGLTHLLVTGAILTSGRALRALGGTARGDRPTRASSLRATGFTATRSQLTPAARRLLDELEGFVERRVRRNFEADRVDGRGRRVLLGLLAAYHADPTLLEPHVLLRFKEIAGVRYLRDLPRDDIEGEVQRRYRRDPRFVRLLADHLSGMTDAYALAEHARLLEMGAIPIPSVEQMRREEPRMIGAELPAADRWTTVNSQPAEPATRLPGNP